MAVSRLFDSCPSEIIKMGKMEKLSAIAGCEGRTVAAETIGCVTPLVGDVSNAELVSALGADIILLNLFDTLNPIVEGLPAHEPADTVRLIKKLTGRLVGINLEPADVRADSADELWYLTEGRRATVENAVRARDMGVDLVIITGNPGVGVTNEGIVRALKALKGEIGNEVILAAGKMHAAGVLSEGGEKIISAKDVTEFAEAGADIILVPAPGTVPGITQDHIGRLIREAHALGKLTMSSIGTSQEGADTQTIRQIALMSKMAGIDIHHVGDSGYTGIAIPENILAYSVTIRGRRHTLRDMARSRVR
jgi:hypothetical protein